MSNERKVWFITRPERDPKFHENALRSLQTATNNFSEKWSGERAMHKRYEEVLANDGLKRENISNDGSGGRTWAAMLRTFSYVYIDHTGKLKPTKVGLALLSGKNVRENIAKQILTLQIPNAYFLDKGFRPKFKPDFQIRPARFLIRLVNQKELDFYITKEEIVFFALTARQDIDLLSVTKMIKQFRELDMLAKEEIKKQIATEFEHRERSDKAARDFAAAHGDVAHTFMLLCDYTELVDYIRGDALRVPAEKQNNTAQKLSELDARYPFSKRYLISPERFAEHAGLDVGSYKASSYGSITPATNSAKSLRMVQQLLADYPLIQTKSEEEISNILMRKLTERESLKFATLLANPKYSALNEDFVESYLNEENDRVFEDKTAEVLKAIGFEVELRPKSVQEKVQTQIEILIHIDEDNICILDAKMYRPKFPLSAHLASHMGSEYLPNYQGYQGKNISSFGYITVSDWSGERNLLKITEKARVTIPGSNIHGALITANALLGFLDYCLDNEIPVEERKRLFMSCFNNKGYRTVIEILRSED
ncbi:restriction endonuclease [Ureibacillus chungkukjangi]|uniref:restriction endonuclease n=1 Tax=Ureibacillus chungkukjangi TaxID=1202712 RepID=UPI000D3C2986|nr:restriction endonuclease [Ureibacillus chungkukjangi]